MSRKVDPSTPSPKMGGIGGSDGIEPSTASGWRPLVGDPLPPGTLLSLRLSLVVTHCCGPVVTHCFEDGIALTMIVQVIDHNRHMPSKPPGHH